MSHLQDSIFNITGTPSAVSGGTTFNAVSIDRTIGYAKLVHPTVGESFTMEFFAKPSKANANSPGGKTLNRNRVVFSQDLVLASGEIGKSTAEVSVNLHPEDDGTQLAAMLCAISHVVYNTHFANFFAKGSTY
jgi:hypothetical protein